MCFRSNYLFELIYVIKMQNTKKMYALIYGIFVMSFLTWYFTDTAVVLNAFYAPEKETIIHT